MESQASLAAQLDVEFDQHLADMKPFVLRLPHKSERQRCALWIKKLCEPPGPGITGRKNRNMHAQLMVHMLKRGSLEGPFTQRPESGPLKTLPTYMSIYFDEPGFGRVDAGDEKNVPDWVADLGQHSLRASSMGDPSATSTLRSSGSARERFAQLVNSPKTKRRTQTALGVERPSSPPRMSYITRDQYAKRKDTKPMHFSSDEEEATSEGKEVPARLRPRSPTGERSPGRRSPRRHSPSRTESDSDWSRPVFPPPAAARGQSAFSFRDEQSLIRQHEREIEMKTKMLEAKFHEEKLRMQQKHDSAVQKILDRKNEEIEDVKTHYRTKAKEQEDTISKLEKKVQTLVKESSIIRENKDKQIIELKKLVEDSATNKQNEYEKKLHDTIANFEQEKFEMQKQHTKNIQELLDDTNARLQKMEQEYSQQMVSTGSVIKELEDRLHQLTKEAENTTNAKINLDRVRVELETKLERSQSQLHDVQARYTSLEHEHQRAMEDNDQEIRSLRNKTDASVEFLKQEHSMASAKAADTIADLEDHVNQLKQAVQDSEAQRQRQIREMEQMYQQDKMHMENLHDKKVQSLKREIDQSDQDSQKTIKKLEQIVKEKDEELVKLIEQHKQHTQQSELALTEFKAQVERNSGRMFDDMKQQMEKVEADLTRSKQLREKQAREFEKQLSDMKQKHEQEVAEIKLAVEQEKAQLYHDQHLEKERLHSERELEVENVRDSLKNELSELEQQSRERQEKDAKTVSDLEQQVRDLREEVVQSNQLRKQQLVELGLLREEEKQKMQRDQEAEIAKLKSQMEQQKLDLQKSHTTEMERTLEKTNSRLKDIEQEYTQRSQKATESAAELQRTIDQLRQEKNRISEDSKRKFAEISSKLEDEKRTLRRQHSSGMLSAQQDLEALRSKVKTLERKLQQQEADHEDKMNDLKYQHEQKLKGLMPAALRQELEDTISSLKSQVNALQQRAMVLQEELDMRARYSTGMQSPARSPVKT